VVGGEQRWGEQRWESSGGRGAVGEQRWERSGGRAAVGGERWEGSRRAACSTLYQTSIDETLRPSFQDRNPSFS
jgi:hypothetical protein